MKAAFYTFGCKVNQYETQNLIDTFMADGFTIAPFEEECDIYVVNSCTVTGEGDHKVRKLLRRLRREHPHALLALTGCYSQAFANIADLVPEADVITGTYNRASLLPAVKRALVLKQRVVDITAHRQGEPFEPMAVHSFLGRTRAFLKIQDGCQRYCAYCIIPKARGPFRSKSIPDLEKELRDLAQSGFKEVVLVGINLSTFGIDTGYRLIDAVRLACSIPGIERVRLSSLEPELLSLEDIRALAALPQFCPQFHLSLQSGCDTTLKRMRRHYTTQDYQKIIENIRTVFSNPAITTDIMVGFPQETEEEFAQSLEFSRAIGFAKMHVFAYSRRPGTAADTMDGQIDQHTKLLRSRAMIGMANKTRHAFLKSQIGKVCKVLFEQKTALEECIGYSENYTPVRIQEKQDLCGQILSVEILDTQGDFCIGRLR